MDKTDTPTISRRQFAHLALASAGSLITGSALVSAAAETARTAKSSDTPTSQILIFDGFDDLDAFGVLEALRWADLPVEFKSVRKQDFITAVSGAKIIPTGPLDLSDPPEVLIVPGGGWPDPKVGAFYEAQRGDILKLLRDFHALSPSRLLTSVCVGGLLLGRAGLLKGRPSTTNRAFYSDLKSMGANLIEARVVDDGDIITASGVTASLDLGLWLVQKLSGVDKALYVSQELDFELRGPIWQRTKA